MYDFVYDAVLSAKYVSVLVLSLFFPTETVMPVVGYAASMQHVSLLGGVAAATAGSSLWAIGIYSISRRFSTEQVYGFVNTYGKWTGLRRKNILTAGRWFDHHARGTIFFSRFVPGVRTAVSVPAGLRRMPFSTFITYTVFGNALDCILLACLGYVAHAHAKELVEALASISAWIIASLCLIVVFYIRRRRR